MMFKLDQPTFDEAKEILKSLVRIDTTNPPGNERAATEYLQGILKADGFACTILEPAPERTNLVCRQRGDGSEEPLLLSCHLDVAPADASRWSHPPFGGDEADGCIWGRGTIDMKGFATMALTVFRALKKNGVKLKRDVIFAAVADEELFCDLGSRYLVENHPDLVRAEYVINEVGGFNVEVRGRRHYLVQVAERGIASLRIKVTGAPGHAAKPSRGSAVERAAEVIRKLSRARLPHHVSETIAEFLRRLSANSRFIDRLGIRALAWPRLGKLVLHTLVPSGFERESMQAILSNTATPTIVRAGSSLNVVPGEVTIDVDGRTSPASSAAEFVEEVRAVIGPDHSIEVLREEPGVEFSPDTPLFREIVKLLKERDPSATTLPTQIFGVTDSRHYAKLGATCYGFYPVQIPSGVTFNDLFHGDDERISIDGFRFGIEALYDLVSRFAGR